MITDPPGPGKRAFGLCWSAPPAPPALPVKPLVGPAFAGIGATGSEYRPERSGMSQDVTQTSEEASRNEAWRGLRARFRAGEPAGGNAPAPAGAPPSAADRVVWFDYAKGICIILVVMMHMPLA